MRRRTAPAALTGLGRHASRLSAPVLLMATAAVGMLTAVQRLSAPPLLFAAVQVVLVSVAALAVYWLAMRVLARPALAELTGAGLRTSRTQRS